MTIAVTGASGFVGAALVEHLVGRGEHVLGIDRAPPTAELLAALAAAPGRFAPVQADVTDRAALAAAFGRGRVRSVIHTATVTAGAERDAVDPEGVVTVNVVGTAGLLRACRDHGVGRVVVASSNAAYGRTMFRGEPLTEDLPSDPVSLYEITKFAAERVALRLGGLYGVDVRIARLGSVFGPWERATGVRDTLSPLFQLCRLAARGEPALLPRPHHRDWIYVRDVAAGLDALLALPDAAPRLLNLGSNAGFTALAWGEALAAHWPGFVCRVAEPGETPNVDVYLPRDRASLDVTALARWTGFAAAYDMARALADYTAWLAAHPAALAD